MRLLTHMDEPVQYFELSMEQRETAKMLHDLLGQAIAARYEDFCHLSAGVPPLNVSKPMAAHALRELDSMLRQVLAVPLEAVAMEDPGHKDKMKATRKQLAALQLDQEAINRAIQSLAPRTSHKEQIRKIVTRLGLDAEGDIANLWIALTDNVQTAHARSFHQPLQVDDDFRASYQQPVDTVFRAVAVALRDRYAALMRRAEALATSTNYVRAVKDFAKEIPDAMQLQWHFFNHLTTGDWLDLCCRKACLPSRSRCCRKRKERGDTMPNGQQAVTCSEWQDPRMKQPEKT
jgi:hypothetical protein